MMVVLAVKQVFCVTCRINPIGSVCGYSSFIANFVVMKFLNRASLPLDQYQIVLLGNRGTWVWTTCPYSYLIVNRPGVKLTVDLSIANLSHQATVIRWYWCWLLMTGEGVEWSVGDWETSTAGAGTTRQPEQWQCRFTRQQRQLDRRRDTAAHQGCQHVSCRN